MATLAIDAARAPASVSLASTRANAHLTLDTARQLERAIPDAVRSIMREAAVAWRELDRIAVCVGPGGFTSIRVTLSYARALALALDLDVVPVDRFAMLAFAAATSASRARSPALDAVPRPALDAVLCPALDGVLCDAGRGRLALQRVDPEGATAGSVELLDERDLDELPGRLQRVAVERDAVARIGDGAAFVRVHVDSMTILEMVGAGGFPSLGHPFVHPLYLRDADARPDAGRPLIARPEAACSRSSSQRH